MKLNLKKKELVNLSHDNKVLPAELTPEVGGGTGRTNVETRICPRTLFYGETCGQAGCRQVF